MMKGGTVDDVVHPSTVIAELILEENNNNDNNNDYNKDNNTKEIQEKETIIIPLYACVWGTIMELNNRNELTPKVLLDDPLLDGHIAIILPSGTFPPERNSAV